MASDTGVTSVSGDSAPEKEEAREEGPKVKTDNWPPPGVSAERQDAAGEIGRALINGSEKIKPDRRIQAAFNTLCVTRHLHALAATALSQQIETLQLPDGEVIETFLRASAKHNAMRPASRREVSDAVANSVLPFAAAECQIETMRAAIAEQAAQAERRKERRQADVPVGYALNKHRSDDVVTTVPRGSLTWLVGSQKDVSAATYAICNNLLRSSLKPRILFLHDRDTLAGNDYQAIKDADGRLILGAAKHWVAALNGINSWSNFTNGVIERLRDNTVDCVVIENAAKHVEAGMTYPSPLHRAYGIGAMLLRWADATGCAVIGGVPCEAPADTSISESETLQRLNNHEKINLHSVRFTPHADEMLLRIWPAATKFDGDTAVCVDSFHRAWYENPQVTC